MTVATGRGMAPATLRIALLAAAVALLPCGFAAAQEPPAATLPRRRDAAHRRIRRHLAAARRRRAARPHRRQSAQLLRRRPGAGGPARPGRYAGAAFRRRRGERHAGQRLRAGCLLSRLRRLAAGRHAAGAGGLPERRPHQRGLRRHGELGPDPVECHPLRRPHRQQPGLRPERHRRRAGAADEDRLRFAGRAGRCLRRLLRPRRRSGSNTASRSAITPPTWRWRG